MKLAELHRLIRSYEYFIKNLRKNIKLKKFGEDKNLRREEQLATLEAKLEQALCKREEMVDRNYALR